jgi:hypothetical protein
MNWEEGQKVECEGLNWGACYVTMSNQHMVVIYCPRYEMVTTASPRQLEQAGWKAVSSKTKAAKSKVVWMDAWKTSDRHNRNSIPKA